MLMNDKIMFDRYYCIKSTKHCENDEKYWHTIFNNLITFSYASIKYAMLDSGRGQVLITKHVRAKKNAGFVEMLEHTETQ